MSFLLHFSNLYACWFNIVLCNSWLPNWGSEWEGGCRAPGLRKAKVIRSTYIICCRLFQICQKTANRWRDGMWLVKNICWRGNNWRRKRRAQSLFYGRQYRLPPLGRVRWPVGRSAGTTSTTASSESPSLPPLAPPGSVTNFRQQGGGDQAFTLNLLLCLAVSTRRRKHKDGWPSRCPHNSLGAMVTDL